ncbi:MAG: class I SAM-dependent methyltransferase [Nitrospira sp.]|nr:MAG: class I SAM-dependent methyltransferase [Nitrospira sp.]
MKSSGVGQEKIWEHFQNEGLDSFSQSRGRLEFLVRRLSPATRVLNIGVGNGVLESLAVIKGVDICSLDPSERSIDRLRQSLGMGDKARAGYSQAIPFADAHFDAVVMSEVLEHLDDAVLEATLNEVHRVLRAGGLFIGTVPARENLTESLVVCPDCGLQFHRWGHKNSFDVERLSAKLATQFSIHEVSERFFIDWESVNWWRKLQGLIKKILSWRGIGTYGIYRSIFFSAEKSH